MTPFRDASMPLPAVALGVFGLVPLVACAAQIALGWPLAPRMTGPALYALTLYGAVVLSFLGGIQWGLAVASADRSDAWRRYGLAIVPSLAAWAGAWIGGRTGLATLAAGFGIWCIYELWSTGLGEAPSWYGRLRVGLSVVAVASLAAAAYYGPF